MALNDAVDQLTSALLARAGAEGDAPSGRTLVIDPMIDRATGNQVAATQSMEARVAQLVRQRFPRVTPQPFTSATLADQPLILVGSIAPVAAPAAPPAASPGVVPPAGASPQAYRISAALADLRTNRIVSQGDTLVRADGVNMTVTPFFRDSPAWLLDRTQAAYNKTSASSPGDPVDPAYLNGLQAAAAVADGVRAYEAGRFGDALMFYARAQGQPAGDQLRVYNGLYLANAALGRGGAAEQAFGSLVSYGLERGKLAMKFVFRPNSTAFWPDRAVSGPYPMWLRQIALRTATTPACLTLVGHTSPTGPGPLNQALSVARAAHVRDLLVSRAPALAPRVTAEGRGSTEPLVGSGRDDATDVLDRRVELETRPCVQPAALVPGRT